MRKFLVILTCFTLLSAIPAFAGFVGPSAGGRDATVSQISQLPIGSYVNLTGNITEHLREDFFTFRDSTGSIRVEIDEKVWANRDVTPETKIRILGEIDTNLRGRYIWVKSITIVQ